MNGIEGGIDRYTLANTLATIILISLFPFVLLLKDWLRKKKGRDP